MAENVADNLQIDARINLTCGMAMPEEVAAKISPRQASSEAAASDQIPDGTRGKRAVWKLMRDEEGTRVWVWRPAIPKVRYDHAAHGGKERELDTATRLGSSNMQQLAFPVEVIRP